jgi:glyoxylase-like metal-dependent hydrolase (beta-lactamase superfamily II)
LANKPSYPFETIEFGTTQEVAPGIHWLRMPLPFPLDHINLWLLEDGDGWTMVDTGYNTEEVRRLWRTLFTGLLGGRPIRRLIVTHFHPDHMSLAGWFVGELGAELWMTHAEWLQAHVNQGDGVTADLERRVVFYRQHGLDDDAIAGYRAARPDFSDVILPTPDTFRRVVQGDEITIGGRIWRVVTGGGHSPEHASLWCEDANVLISGDQVLPRITSNVSVFYYEPDGDPLRLFLTSFDRFRHLPDDVLVLPSHNLPFHGLHDRLDAIDEHHRVRLDAAWEACAAPTSGVELISAIFSRKLDSMQAAFALGETLAHANYLISDGRMARQRTADDRIRYLRV